jgi:predicted tellurium resistance membrane protein TerC
VLRVMTLASGAWFMNTFTTWFYVLGAFGLYTGIKLLISNSEEHEDEERTPHRNCAVRIVRRFGPVVGGDHGNRFFVRHKGARAVTAGAFCLVSIVLSDFVFALDSISVVSVSRTIFIVVTSNVLATLALHSLYFVLVGRTVESKHPRIGIGFVFVIIGAKMLARCALRVARCEVWISCVVHSATCAPVAIVALQMRHDGDKRCDRRVCTRCNRSRDLRKKKQARIAFRLTKSRVPRASR